MTDETRERLKAERDEARDYGPHSVATSEYRRDLADADPLAEIDALTIQLADLQRARDEEYRSGVARLQQAISAVETVARERDEARAEVDRLRALVEAAYREGNKDGGGDLFLWAESEARAALAPPEPGA